MEKVGKYQILEKLGQGGMGVVYKALDTLIERVVAVKMVASNLDADPELRTRFFREGRAAGQLSHKNIVTIFDLGEENGTAYIAMEFLEGRDLRSEIAKGNPVDLRDKIRIMAEVCEGLAHAHERNVIHRDIKPANIFITTAGQAKILDFGLARITDSDLTTGGHALGTPNYMSPEQVRGEKIDHRTDIFAVGVSFYELLTGRKAFQGDSFTSTIYKILQDEPEPIEHYVPAIPADLCAIVYKGLAKDREQRYQNLGELLRDLDAFCRSSEIGFTLATEQPESTRTAGGEIRSHPGSPAARAPMSPGIPKGAASEPGSKKRRNSSPNAASRSVQQSGHTNRDAVLTGAGADPHEESTRIEVTPKPPTPWTPRRYLTIGSVAVVVFASLILILAHYRTGKPIQPGNNHVLASSSPPPSLQPPQVTAPPVNQPAPPADGNEEVSIILARASSALTSNRFSEAAAEAGKALNRSPGNDEARSILRKASESLDLVRTGIPKTKTYIAAGDYQRARAALGEVLRVAPADNEALQLAAQLNQIARKNADQARDRLEESKSKAELARVSALATRSLEAAQSAEAQANRLYGQGKFAEAATKSAEAGELYARAENEAHAESATLAEKSSKMAMEQLQQVLRAKSDSSRQGYDRVRDLAVQAGVPDKARDQFGAADKTAAGARAKWDSGDFDGAARDYEAATIAMQQAHSRVLEATRKEASKPADLPNPAAPGPSTGQPAADSHDTVEAAQKAIYGVPEQYKAAMEGKDLALLKNIWPALSAQQELAFRNQWAYTRTLRITPQMSKIEKLEGDSAIVSVRLHYEQEINDGTSRKWDQKATFSLGRRGRSWIIESARFEALH